MHPLVLKKKPEGICFREGIKKAHFSEIKCALAKLQYTS